MNNVVISPAYLRGNVTVPPSKSMAHRLLISASLADGISVIDNIALSDDITATINALSILGAEISVSGSRVTVKGIINSPDKAVIDCNESGSTMRFLIPVCAALGVEGIFIGKGKLPSRPIDTYINSFKDKGIIFNYNNTMPFSFSGKLKSGKFYISGNISSQFITGLLYALPLLDGDSEIILTSSLQSEPYVDMTVDSLAKAGIIAEKTDKGYYIKGNQKFRAFNAEVEGDYSQAAFYLVADALGSNININGLDENSHQGDKKIIEIIKEISYNKNNLPDAFTADCSQCPDIVPILSVLACFCNGTSVIENVARLRIKESDRLSAMTQNLNAIGGKVTEYPDKLVIEGINHFDGGIVDSFNDHRIAMSMAIAATRCKRSLTIKGAQCINKSYPDFFEDYIKLGGNINVINVE